MITYNISHLIYMILIWLSILTSSKLLLLRATWKREKEFRNLSLNVGAVKILQNNFYFLLGNMRLFVRKAFDILYWAVCHIFQCDIFCQREMRFCAFCHLLFWFSMIPLLCPHHLLFHYSKSLQAICLYPWFHFIGTSSRFFVFLSDQRCWTGVQINVSQVWKKFPCGVDFFTMYFRWGNMSQVWGKLKSTFRVPRLILFKNFRWVNVESCYFIQIVSLKLDLAKRCQPKHENGDLNSSALWGVGGLVWKEWKPFIERWRKMNMTSCQLMLSIDGDAIALPWARITFLLYRWNTAPTRKPTCNF